MTFFESLETAARAKGGPLCVGIDPRLEPDFSSRERLADYGKRVVDATAEYSVAFKPQLAFFERHGAAGLDALDDILAHIRGIDVDYPVILDAKRGDIGSTAEAYAAALLDRPGCLAVTLSPYLGRESVDPFMAKEGRGLFLLCRTTNPGAGRLQEALLADGMPFYLKVADEVLSWGGQTGLVVAGNSPQALRSVRERHGDCWFLAPGIGAQGGKVEDAVAAGARSDGFGLLASASRSVADATNPGEAARELRDALDAARETFLSKTAESTYSLGSNRTHIPLNEAEREALLEGLFKVGAFKIGTFTLKSGKESPFYVDLRRIQADPALLRLTGRAYADLLGNVEADRLAGIPVAALPLATAASLETGMSLIYPRMEKKAHGSGARVEGDWCAGQKTVMLDDLITTGGSKREAATILRDVGLVVEDLVVLIERGTEGRKDMEEAGIRLHAWARIEDLTAVGRKTGWMTAEDQKRVLDFAREA